MEKYLSEKFSSPHVDPEHHDGSFKDDICELAPHLRKDSDVIYMGTTLCAIKCKDGIIACSDSRTSSGTIISNEFSNKITTISSNIISMQCGRASSSQKLVDIGIQEAILFERLHGTPIPVIGIVKRISLYLNKYHEILGSAFIIAGYDEIKGFQIYQLKGGSFYPLNVATMGSGSIYIYEAIMSFYDENKNVQESIDSMQNMVLHAIHSDVSSGGIVNTVYIKKDEGIVTQPLYDGSARLDYIHTSNNVEVLNQ